MVVWVFLKKDGGFVQSDTFAYILRASFYDGWPIDVKLIGSKLIGSGIHSGRYLACNTSCDNSLPEHEDCFKVCEPAEFGASVVELDSFVWERNLWEWQG